MNIRYIVKPQDKMVIGIYETSSFEILSKVGKHLDPSIWNDSRWTNTKWEYQYEKIVLKAFARCDERDEFDEEYGKRLVRAKLAYKADRLALDYAHEIRQNLENMLKNFDKNAFYRAVTNVDNDRKDLREHYGLHTM